MDIEESFTSSETCAGKNTTRAKGEPFVLFERHEKNLQASVHHDEHVTPHRSQPPLSPWCRNHSGSPHQQLAMEGRKRHKRLYNSNIFDQLSLICDELEMHYPFVRKLTILVVQLSLIYAMTIYSMVNLPVKYSLRGHTTILMIMSLLFLFTYFSLTCFKPLRRKFPMNYILFLMLTISMSYVVAYVSSLYHNKVLRVVLPTNMLICLVVSLSTCQKKFKRTKWLFIIAPASFFMYAFCMISFISTVLGCRKLWVIQCGLMFPHFSVFLLYDFVLYSALKRFFILPYDDMFFGRKAYGIITGKM